MTLFQRAALRALAFLCLVTGLAFPGLADTARTVPRLTGTVNDYAQLLSPQERASLEAQLQSFEVRTGNQVVLLTVASLEEEPLEDFSIRVAEEWKIGRQGTDNGAILLVAPREKKVRIEVGYGLEGVLTDAECDRIIQRAILPRFREGSFPEGISAGLTGIMQVIQGPGGGPSGADTPPGDKRVRVHASTLLVLLLSFFFFFARMGRFFHPGGPLGGVGWGGRGLGRTGSGGFGGFGGFGGGGGGRFGGGGASGSW